MAKGRKLTTSRSERYLGSFGGQVTANSASELREEDVWPVADDDDRSVYGEWTSRASTDSGRSFDAYSRGRRSNHNQIGGLSLAFDEDESSNNTASQRIVHQYREGSAAESPRGGRNFATSAPVNVPDWSKIYRVDSVESLHDSDDGFHEAEPVPPHEYLAREYARSRKIAANSVFEGVGRTLKGRDMSRVRDAVWSQTGFDG